MCEVTGEEKRGTNHAPRMGTRRQSVFRLLCISFMLRDAVDWDASHVARFTTRFSSSVNTASTSFGTWLVSREEIFSISTASASLVVLLVLVSGAIVPASSGQVTRDTVSSSAVGG